MTAASSREHAWRATLRIGGWCALGLIAIVAVMNDFLSHAAAGSTMVGPALDPPSLAFPFGTDILGRDVYSETLHGLWVTLWRAMAATLIALVAGGFFGTTCARLPGWLAVPLRAIVGVLAGVPALLLALLIVALTTHNLAPVAAGLATAPLGFVRAFDHAKARSGAAHAAFARATGISTMALLRRDFACELNAGLLVHGARALAAATIILSTVSFLGFGTLPPSRDLGLMISAAKGSYIEHWWTAFFPALMVVLVVLSARLAASLDEGERP